MKTNLKIKDIDETMDTLYVKSSQIKAQRNIKLAKRKLNEYIENNKLVVNG